VLSRDTLFTGEYFNAQSDLHPDGDRLIVPQSVAAAEASESGAADPQRFILVTNWFTELRQRTGN
jgi:hypothetical protein